VHESASGSIAEVGHDRQESATTRLTQLRHCRQNLL
jgi:hypothetical protein